MSSEIEYLKNRKPDKLYTDPGKQGTYVTIVGDNEKLLGEFEITLRSRVAVKAFYVNGKKDFSTFKIIKMKFHKTHGWSEDESITVNNFDLSNISTFLSIISSLDLSDAKKARVNLGNIAIEQLQTLLSSSSAVEVIQKLSESPNLHTDIYAVASKRNALAEFKSNMDKPFTEPKWLELL